jgi:putative membrane protein
MAIGATYCGAPPLPGTLLERFNLDPILIVVLLVTAAMHWRAVRKLNGPTGVILAGWTIALTAFASPLCALSVSLFSARVGQHMILVLLASPLIAAGLPASSAGRSRGAAALWASTAAFLIALWFWHMPSPYAATFGSTPVYWAMHLSLFGSAIWLWAELLGHSRHNAAAALAAATVSSMQMGLLGAIITLANHPLYTPHIFTTSEWGFSPLADQQLGGVLMWVPGCGFFLWIATRSFRLMLGTLEGQRA